MRLAEEIRCLPNDHEAKVQVLEVSQREFFQEVFSAFLFFEICSMFSLWLVFLSLMCNSVYLCEFFLCTGFQCRLERYHYMQQVQLSKKFRNWFSIQSKKIEP